MKAKLYKVLDQYHLYNEDKAIATTIVGNPMLLPNLSKQNCDEIFGVVDVEKLADDVVMNYLTEGNPNGDFKKSTIGMDDNIIWWKAGFNKAMELNKSKLFTLEDMATMMLEAVKWANDGGEIDAQKLLDNTIQSLQQPTEIDVVIVMEENANIALKARSMQFSTQRATNAIKEAWFPKPKLDSEGCLVLRKL